MTRPENGDDRRGRRIIVVAPPGPDASAKIAEVLAEAEIVIESIDDRLVEDLGVIAIRTSDDDAAQRALLEAGIRAVTSDAVVYPLPDRPGALAGVAQRLANHQLNVRTIHIVHRKGGRAVVALKTDDDWTARAILDEHSPF